MIEGRADSWNGGQGFCKGHDENSVGGRCLEDEGRRGMMGRKKTVIGMTFNHGRKGEVLELHQVITRPAFWFPRQLGHHQKPH